MEGRKRRESGGRRRREDGGKENEGEWQKGGDTLEIVGSPSAVACHYRAQSCRPQQNTGDS